MGTWLGEGIASSVTTPAGTNLGFTTYAELLDAIARWLNRTDLTSVIPDFVTLAEAQIARRLRTTTVRASTTLTSAATALPSTCAELRSIRLNSDGHLRAIPIVTPDNLADFRSDAAGVVRAASVVNGTLLFDRTPSGGATAEIIYYSRLIPLGANNTTNAVLQSAPDLYLYGALKEAAPYLENDERVGLWTSKFEDALGHEEIARERSEYGASLRPVRLPVVFG